MSVLLLLRGLSAVWIIVVCIVLGLAQTMRWAEKQYGRWNVGKKLCLVGLMMALCNIISVFMHHPHEPSSIGWLMYGIFLGSFSVMGIDICTTRYKFN